MPLNLFTTVLLFIFGVILGSFINALVWRLHEQLDADGNPKKLSKKRKNELSISKGRSMCPHCKHELAAKDLVPVLSWLSLRGKCRYCKVSISKQYPVVELLTGILFAVSYIFWPESLALGWQKLFFATWLIASVGLVALFVYDLTWMLLPDRIVFKLYVIVFLSYMVQFALGRPTETLFSVAFGAVVGGGFFWILYQLSKGAWIGGGDVKLGFLLGFLLGSGSQALLMLFVASILGLLVTLPALLTKKASRSSRIPFGPFLIAATFLTMLWGQALVDWYMNILTPLS